MSIYVPGKVTLAQQQKIPVVIGEPWGGGYFAGYISHTADGNPTHALIVAPRATGATGTGYSTTTTYEWKDTNFTQTSGASSFYDGRANTDAIIAAGIDNHPAAKYCVNLSIDGFTDWYLPARAELEIAYFNLKPTTASNTTSSTLSIANSYAVPPRVASNYLASYPTQTTVSLFSTSAESFSASSFHWASTQIFISSYLGSLVTFSDGNNSYDNHLGKYSVRAFRRIEL